MAGLELVAQMLCVSSLQSPTRDVKLSLYQQLVERDQGICQECAQELGGWDRAAHEIHHIVRRGYWGKNAKHRGEVVSNLICLCWHHHHGAHTKEAQHRHLTYLRKKWGYDYSGQPWLGLLGEA